LRFFTLIQGIHPNWRIAGECFALLEVKLWGPNGAFQMGVAGWRFAQMKKNLGGRTGIVAVLEEWR
jgi:hypothetical protein